MPLSGMLNKPPRGTLNYELWKSRFSPGTLSVE